MNALYQAHSGLRYLVLLTGLAALLVFAYALIARRPVRGARGFTAAFTGLLDLQVVLGFGLFLGGIVYGALMGHIVMMLLAAVAANGAAILAPRTTTERRELAMRYHRYGMHRDWNPGHRPLRAWFLPGDDRAVAVCHPRQKRTHGVGWRAQGSASTHTNPQRSMSGDSRLYAHWQEMLKRHWDIDAPLAHLPGEFDLNFLAVSDGAHILKVMRAGCESDFVDMQCRALEHVRAQAAGAAAPGAVPVPEVVRTTSNAPYTTVADEAGQPPRIVWLMT